MGNIVTNPKAFYITKRAPYEYIMKNGFSAAFANADAMPKYKGIPFALTDAREQLGRYGDCVIPVTLEGTYEVQRMQNGIDYVFVPLDSADKIHIERSRNTVKLSESKLRKIVSQSIKKVLKEDYDFNADYEDGGSVYDRWGEPTEEEAFRDIVLKRLCNALNAEATRIIDDYEYEWQEGQKVINKIWQDTYGDAPGLSYLG